MSYTPIVTTTSTFVERSRGVYIRDSVQFGQPSNSLRIRPNTQVKNPSLSIVRSKQVDVPSGAATLRIGANVSVTISVPAAGFPIADLDVMLTEIAEFITAASLSRLLQGEA